MNNPSNLNIIVALTSDNAIGRRGDLIFRISDDMRHFREITMGHTVVMGRKTWQSLPKGALPGRRNIVVSRDPAFSANGAEVYHSLDEVFAALSPDEETFIIGGEQLYRQTLPLATRLYLTLIDATAGDADTFFPEIDPAEWQSADPAPESHTDPKTGITFRYVCLSRACK